MRPASWAHFACIFPEAETAGEEQADRAWCSSSRERKGWRRSQGGASGREGGGGAAALLLVLQQGFPIIPDPQVELRVLGTYFFRYKLSCRMYTRNFA
jgi:hypothetical protein